jgi:C1q domain
MRSKIIHGAALLAAPLLAVLAYPAAATGGATASQAPFLENGVPSVDCQSQHPTVGFSAWDEKNGTSGNDTELAYNNVAASRGGAWNGRQSNATTFTAPCKGLYVFSFSFEKDATGRCGATTGTTDDVTMYIRKNGTPVSGMEAWAGQSSAIRASAATSTVLSLAVGDEVTSWVHSDGGKFRCLALYNFSGYLVSP